MPVDLFSLVPVKRSHSVCAQGGINASVNTKGEGDSPQVHLEETVLRRRLPRQPAAGQGACATPRPASSTCSTAWACPSTARPRGCSISAASAARSSTARRSPAPPPASSCSTRSTSRCAAGRRSTSRTTRAIASPARRWCASSRAGTSSRLVLDDSGICRGIVAQDLKNDARSSPSPATPCAWPPAAAASSSASRPTA